MFGYAIWIACWFAIMKVYIVGISFILTVTL